MDEFKKQVERNLINDINEFNNNPKYYGIKELYKANFARIVFLIEKFEPKHSIEDIAKIDKNLSNEINENLLFLSSINGAILKRKLTLDDLK